MKKVMILVLLVFAAISVLAQGSEQKSSILDDMNFEIKTLYGLKQHDMRPMDLSMQLSCSFTDRLSLLLSAERNHTLFDVNDGKWYADGTSFGGGVAYVWLKDGYYRYDMRLQVVNTIGSPKWKRTAYDLGVTLYEKREKRSLSPVLGLGFRYQKSHTAGIRNWCGLYATVGIRF